MGIVIDATDKFAQRVAEWMNDSTLSHPEMSRRLAKWPESFIRKVLEEHRKLVENRRPR